MVLPPRGLSGQGMGGDHTEQPVVGKVSVGPAMMVPATTPTSTPRTFAKDASQTHAHPAVEIPEGSPVGVLEIREPTSQGPVRVGHDKGQAVARGPFRLRTNGGPEFIQAFATREATMLHESIAQEFKSLPPSVRPRSSFSSDAARGRFPTSIV